MIGKVEQGHSSCAMEGLSDILRITQFAALALKLDRGEVPLTRITRQDGEELREKAKNVGGVPEGMPSCWWGGELDNIIELWPRASKDYNIVGVNHAK